MGRSTIVMYRSGLLAAVLVMAVGGIVQAASPPAVVAGSYTYTTDGGGHRTVSIRAQGADPVRGTWSFQNRSGPITCMVVDGPDAWLAGPTSSGELAAFLYVHDGGTPGTAGDAAVTWISDPGQTLADMESWCRTSYTEVTRYSLTSGDLAIGFR